MTMIDRHPPFASRSLRIARSVACAAIAIVSASTVSFGQCSYEVTKEFTAGFCFPGHPKITIASGLSDNGIVVGRYEICGTPYTEAFMWVPSDNGADGVFTTLPRPGNVISASAVGVNSHGIVVGGHQIQGVGWKGFAYDSNSGEFRYLEPLHPPSGPLVDVSTARSINDSSVVTGSRVISAGGQSPVVRNAVVWLPYGENGDGREIIIDLGVGDGPSSGANDGNDSADVAGWSGTSSAATNAMALLWIDSDAIELGVLPGANQSSARSLNNALDVVGTSRIPGPNGSPAHGFIWSNWQMTHLLPEVPFERFSPNDVSDALQVVGALVTPSISAHAALWRGGKFFELKSLLDDPAQQFSSSSAGAINSLGQILAGRYLLTPVNVPNGDLNFDCAVDVHDLLYLLNEWGKPNSTADLTGNGTVGVADLLILLANWGS